MELWSCPTPEILHLINSAGIHKGFLVGSVVGILGRMQSVLVQLAYLVFVTLGQSQVISRLTCGFLARAIS